MEHTISAPTRGTVKAFRCAPGDQVVDGVDLVDFEVGRGMTLVRIVEMGPRDGLQNETQLVPLATKLELIERLAAARAARDRGHLLRVAEVGAADGRP